MLLIMFQEPDFRKTHTPTVMKLKVSSVVSSILIYGIKTLQNQNMNFTYRSVIFALGVVLSPSTLIFYC